MPGIVSFCHNRPLEPGDGFVIAFEFDQVRADIVVGIAEFRIYLDGALAFFDRFLDFSLEVEGPPEKRVGLGRRVQGKRSPVEVDSAVKVTLHLSLVRLLEPLQGLRYSIRWVPHFSSTAPNFLCRSGT